MQGVDPRLDLLDEFLVVDDPRHLAIEVVRQRHEVRRFLRPFVNHRQFPGDRIQPRVQLGHQDAEAVHPIQERPEHGAVGIQGVAHLRGFGVRLVERIHLLLERHEFFAERTQRLELPGGAAGEILHVDELRLQVAQGRLLLLEFRNARAEDSCPRLEFVDLLRHGRNRPVARRQGIGRRLEGGQAGLDDGDALIELIELPAFGLHLLLIGADEVRQHGAIAIQAAEVQQERIPRLVRQLELVRGVGAGLGQPIDDRLGLGDLPHAVVQLRDLGVHVPHHLAQPVRLDDGVLHDLFLGLHRPGLLRDVLDQDVEGVDPLAGSLGQVVERPERRDTRFRFFGGFQGLLRQVARVAGGIPHPRVVLSELGAHRTDLIEVGLDGREAVSSLAHLAARVAQLLAHVFEGLALLADHLDVRAGRHFLRRQLFGNDLVFRQFAVRPEQLRCRALRFGHLRRELVDAVVEPGQGARPLLDGIQARRDAIERTGYGLRQFLGLRERIDGFVDRAFLDGQRCDGRGQGLAFLLGCGDQVPQFSHAPDGVEHAHLPRSLTFAMIIDRVPSPGAVPAVRAGWAS